MPIIPRSIREQRKRRAQELFKKGVPSKAIQQRLGITERQYLSYVKVLRKEKTADA